MFHLQISGCLSAVAVTLLLITACSVGPDYVRPTVTVPPAFKEMSGWKVAEPRDDAGKGPWWEIFNDPQLNTLEQQVNISNQNVVAAEAQFREARALAQAARAGYFPTLTAGASATRSRTSGNLSSTTRSGATLTDYFLGLNLSWELDVWGKVRRTVEAGRASAQASAADLEALRLSTQAQLAQDYFQLRTFDAQKKLLDATVSAYRKFLELTKNRYASGVASRGDVLQAETQLKTTEAQAIDVGVQRAQLEHAIAVLIGKPASLFSIPFTPLAALPPTIPVGVPSALLERRPDIAAAERSAAAANARIGVAKAAYFPTITLSASGGFESSSLSQWLTWPSRLWSVGPAISETLFDGGLRRAQDDQTRATYDASVAAYRQTVLAAFQGVEDNLSALRILEQEALVQGEAVKAAQQSMIFTTNQYKAGTVSALDVINTQVTDLNNERTAITILGSRMTASVLLINALGGGWNSSTLPSADELGKHDDK
ncbi:MAG: efflux transporter outer membrane subunit [Geobacteraceae bacterium]|nr:efflux transporter outer membrane subunit [Geobacteraceae bacterium]